MTPILHEKHFYHRASRHSDEAYCPVVAPDGRALAYLQVSAENEMLMLQRAPDASALALSAPGFLFSPCFAGEWLLWVERIEDRWAIRSARWQEERPSPRTMVISDARPIHLVAAASDTGAWVAWEERLGRTTRLQLARLDASGKIEGTQLIGSARVNAYDPALAVATDGSVYCAYSAYSDDNYRILLARFTADGMACGELLRLSDSIFACVWPSLWPAANGGVWWSFTCFAALNSDHLVEGEGVAYVKHARYLQQRHFFDRRGVVYTGWCDGANQWAPMAKTHPIPLPFHLATGLVFGSEGAGHSQVLEDAAGGLHVLMRQYAPAERTLPCEAASQLKVHHRFRPMQAWRMHANLSLVSLMDGVWQPANVIVPRAHFDFAIALRFDGRRLTVAFGEDRRRTGWSGEGEWFDDVGEIGVGVARVEVPPKATEHAFHPLAIAPVPGGRMTTPLPNGEAMPDALGRQFALGQTHCHSSLSVCMREFDRDPHFNYRFMQDVQHCHFGTLTDHDYNLWQTEMLLLRKLADYYYFPGEFVALPSYEWTGSEPRDCSHDGGPFGHVNVLGFEPLTFADFHTPNDPHSPGNSLPKLWRCMAGRRVITPPHHVADYAHFYHWEFWQEEFEPVIEVFQDDRGSAEQAAAPGLTNWTRLREPIWAVDELRRGKKFGFIAAGDHRGIALAGVWTRAVTREALYEGFRARACYGTTGLHCGVRFTCNGHSMGSEGAGAPGKFELSVQSAAPIARVEVLRNGELTRTLNAAGASGEQEWKWTEDTAVPGDFWYCRIHWADGELAWTSPIWC
jgi:hypothetical protein